jgi:hypothetical protein
MSEKSNIDKVITAILFTLLFLLFIAIDIWILKSIFNLISYHTFSSALKLSMGQAFFLWLLVFYLRLTTLAILKNNN